MASVNFNGNGLADMKIVNATYHLSDGTPYDVKMVYVIPHQGVLIDHILCRETWTSEDGKQGHQDRITNGNQAGQHNYEDEAFPEKPYSYYIIGVGWWNGTIFESLDNSTFNITVYGEPAQDTTIDVHVFNDAGDSLKTAWFRYKNGDKIETCLYRVCNNSHKYSNIVLLDKEYDLQGDSIPDSFYINHGFSFYPNGQYHYDDLSAVTSESHGYQVLSFNFPQDYDVKSVLIYEDCFLSIFRPVLGHQQVNENEYYVKHSYDAYTSKKQGIITTMKVPMVHFKELVSDKILYPSVEHYNDDPAIEGWYTKGVQTVPNEHRWICNKPIYNGSKIHPCCDIVRLTKKNSNQKISSILKVGTQGFSRYTQYFVGQLLPGQRNKSDMKILKEDDCIPSEKIQNKFFYPIVKPWAECNLTIFQKDDTAFSSVMKDFFQKRVDKFYGKNRMSSKKYYKRYEANAKDTFDEVDATIIEYLLTVSPFRNEFWLCHGTREEYDENKTDSQNGQSGLCISSDQEIYCEYFKNMHNNLAKWNNDYPIYLGLFIQACFSGGIQQGTQRNILMNGICENSESLLPGIENLFWYVSAIATNVSQVRNGLPGDWSFLRKCLKNISYKDCPKEYNNQISRRIEKTYELIHYFYTTSYEKLRECLIDEDLKEAFDFERPYILQDLNNRGKMYFSTYEYPETYKRKDGTIARLEQYYASDNHFDRDTKRHVINDGFIGLMKRGVITCGTIYNRSKQKKYIYSSPEEIPTDLQANSEIVEDLILVKDRLDRLSEDVIFTWDDILGNDGDSARTRSIEHPIIGCSGKFAESDRKVFNNPDQELDELLTSDKELEEYREAGGLEL